MPEINRKLICSFIVFVFCSQYAYPAGVVEDEIVPDWTLQTDRGKEINFYRDSQNNVSVILFWATWCPYCRALMPYLQQIADQYKGTPVKFYALNVWEDGDPVKYMNENGFTFTLLVTADLIAEDYGVQGTPGLLVVDADHRVRYMRRSGEDELDVKIAVLDAIESSLPGL